MKITIVYYRLVVLQLAVVLTAAGQCEVLGQDASLLLRPAKPQAAKEMARTTDRKSVV